MRVIEMNFLPDVSVICESCQGKRYNRETLEVRYQVNRLAMYSTCRLMRLWSFQQYAEYST